MKNDEWPGLHPGEPLRGRVPGQRAERVRQHRFPNAATTAFSGRVSIPAGLSAAGFRGSGLSESGSTVPPNRDPAALATARPLRLCDSAAFPGRRPPPKARRAAAPV